MSNRNIDAIIEENNSDDFAVWALELTTEDKMWIDSFLKDSYEKGCADTLGSFEIHEPDIGISTLSI